MRSATSSRARSYRSCLPPIRRAAASSSRSNCRRIRACTPASSDARASRAGSARPSSSRRPRCSIAGSSRASTSCSPTARSLCVSSHSATATATRSKCSPVSPAASAWWRRTAAAISPGNGWSEAMKHLLGTAGKIAHAFIDSKLTPLVIAAALLVGVFAIWQTPREEEPQIVVPMLDVFVQMPGASAAEVEHRATVPMEKLIREVPGVEYVYSISRPGLSMLVVRFYVGEKEEDAILRTYNKLYSNFDRIPAGVSQPIIKVRSIDDVPIMAVTLWGKNYDSYQLRQIAGELDNQLKQIDDVSETKIIGGL